MIYYIVLFLIIVLHFLVKNRDKFCAYIGVLLVLFAGLRGAYVGPDTYQYQWIFEDIQRNHNAVYGFFFLEGQENHASEPGYNIFQTIVGHFANYEFFKKRHHSFIAPDSGFHLSAIDASMTGKVDKQWLSAGF